jgi:hypothetical protein
LLGAINMKFETAVDLLTWKNGEVEENIVLEFAQQYEKLTDDSKKFLTSKFVLSMPSLRQFYSSQFWLLMVPLV